MKDNKINIPLSNLHTHSSFCDGTYHPEVYIQDALEKKGNILGFSSHAPFPFEKQWTMKYDCIPEYFDTLNQLKEVYRHKIKIMIGLEADYIPTIIQPSLIADATMFSPLYYDNTNNLLKETKEEKKYRLDYVIGAVHHIMNLDDMKHLKHEKNLKNSNDYIFTVDSTPENFKENIDIHFNNDIKKAVITYYNLVEEMVVKCKPTLCAHFDLIKKNNTNNCFFDESETWYYDIVFNTLKTISQTGTILEINTGGLSRKRVNAYYPSGWILSICSKLDIPITISSDAHHPNQLYALYSEAISFAKEQGIKQIVIPSDNNNGFTPFQL